MRYCDEALINCDNYGAAITFDLATSEEKKEKKKAIAETRRRQRSQRYYEVPCKSVFTQKIQRVERVQRIKKVENCCLQAVELGI